VTAKTSAAVTSTQNHGGPDPARSRRLGRSRLRYCSGRRMARNHAAAPSGSPAKGVEKSGSGALSDGTTAPAAARPRTARTAAAAATPMTTSGPPSSADAHPPDAVLTDRVLADRLRAAGPARAANFSWLDTARRHVELYRLVAGRGA